MSSVRKIGRALYKSLTYRILDCLDAAHARLTQRTWYTPGAAAAREWLRVLEIADADTAVVGGQAVVNLAVMDGLILCGPASPEQWNSMSVRIARMQRIAKRAGVHRWQELTTAHYALLDNILNRYVAEFCAYPYQSLRTAGLLPGDVFVDIGAFRGYVAVKAARKVGAQGRVYAIEPVEENFWFLERHREINGLDNITTLCAAITGEAASESIDFFRTKNQGNSCIQDHLQEGAQTIRVPSVDARSLLDRICREMPTAQRIICSVTTNGTEMMLAEAMMEAFDQGGQGRMEIIIPIIFTKRQAKSFAARMAERGWCCQFHYPWLRLWRYGGVG